MFIGTYYYSIEEKGRVSLPKEFRAASDSWIITRGLDGGLFIFPSDQFAAELEKLQNLGFTKKVHRDFTRLLTNEAQELHVDKTGRILIPEYLRATAQLTKHIVVIGSYQRIEIWDRDRYHTYLAGIEPNAETIAEQVQSMRE